MTEPPVHSTGALPTAEERRIAALESLARTVRWTVVTGLIVLVLRSVADLCLLLFAAILLATLLRGASDWLGRVLRLRPGAALGVLLLVFVAVVGGAIWWRGTYLVDEAARLSGQLRGQLDVLRHTLQQSAWGNALWDRFQQYLSGAGARIAGLAAGVATSTLGVIGSLLILLVTALYLTLAPGLYMQGVLQLLPHRWRPQGLNVMGALAHTLRRWFIGQALDMLVVGVLSGVGLTLLGVPLALPLALIAALFNFVPYIGALAGAVPAVLVGLGQGVDQGLSVGVLYLCVQGLEGYLVGPLIQRRTAHLPPVLTILGQTMLGTLFGPLGLILATPAVAAGMVAVRMIYVEEIVEGPPESDRTLVSDAPPDEGGADLADPRRPSLDDQSAGG